MEVIYKFVTLDATGKMVEDIYNELTIYNVPYTYTGYFQSRWAREELQGQPTFSEFAGPMYDGEQDSKPVIRYETYLVNDRLNN